MYHDFNYQATLASSLRAQWQLDDVLREDQELDFSRNFMPESLARTRAVEGLNAFEQKMLNQISAHRVPEHFRHRRRGNFSLPARSCAAAPAE